MAAFDKGEVMMCHYEVMQLSMTCKTEEIKKQYKVMALRYHPDRNHGNEEEATLKFKQLAAAYAVLSDPHERKWYDDHREAILRGGNGTAGEDGDADDSINVWRFFNSTCYTGHSDESETGFYAVYRGVFEDIAQREQDKTKSDPTLKYATITLSFGNSETPIAEVLHFYSEWENFASKLNFAWSDVYHTVDAPNRATRRVMEAENNKARTNARREYTNQIRSLARFVKKRDPRVAAYEADVLRRKQEAEELKRALKAEEMQARKEKREKIKQEYENNLDEIETRAKERKGAFLLADNSSDDEDRGAVGGGADSEDEKDVQRSLQKMSLGSSSSAGGISGGIIGTGDAENANTDAGETVPGFHCALCCKEFKTDLQLSQHINSKPHRTKVKEQMKSQKKGGGKDKDKEKIEKVDI